MTWRDDAKESKFLLIPEEEYLKVILDVREDRVREGVTPKYGRPCWDFDAYKRNDQGALEFSGKILRVTAKGLLRQIDQSCNGNQSFFNATLRRSGEGKDTVYDCKFEPIDDSQQRIE